MKKNEIKYYAYMAFILSSLYFLASCASNIDSNMMKKNVITNSHETSKSSLDYEKSTKEIEKTSDEPNNLTKNEEEFGSKESDIMFQNAGRYADCSIIVDYKKIEGFIEDIEYWKKCLEARGKDKNDLQESDEHFLKSFSRRTLVMIQECMDEILSKIQSYNPSAYAYEKNLFYIINQISTLKKGETLFLRTNFYNAINSLIETFGLKNDIYDDDKFLMFPYFIVEYYFIYNVIKL